MKRVLQIEMDATTGKVRENPRAVACLNAFLLFRFTHLTN
jgi:hypothetical protein